MPAPSTSQIISALYVATFNRAPDKAGLDFWKQSFQSDSDAALKQLAEGFASHPAFEQTYGGMDNSTFVQEVYLNVLGGPGDIKGIDFWTTNLDNGALTRPAFLAEFVKASLTIDLKAMLDNGDLTQAEYDGAVVRQDYLYNKANVGLTFATLLSEKSNLLDNTDENDLASLEADPAYQASVSVLKDVNNSASSVNEATDFITAAKGQDDPIAYINEGGNSTGQTTFELTNGTDSATAEVFNAGLVYTPGGDFRVNSLQSEDELTGTGDNATLNATLGNVVGAGAGDITVTPVLNNIKTVNLDFTGNTNTIDMRSADSLEVLAINRITAETIVNDANIDNISQKAADLTVKDTSSVAVNVNFNYVNGVLAGTRADESADEGKLTLSQVNAATVKVGNEVDTEGFETVNLNSTKENNIDLLTLDDLETLNISGDGRLSVGVLDIGDGIGIRSIDASAFSGSLNLDISDAVGSHVDPINSGKPFNATIKGGSGNDVFTTFVDINADSPALRDSIDGNSGDNTLVTWADIDGGAKITNIQSLEVRLPGSTANLNAFDDKLANVLIRDELDSPAAPITINNVGKSLAESGNIVLRHADANTTSWGGTININMKDASGSKDTVAITVENDLNTFQMFDYQLNIDGDVASQKVENVTVNDNDTESNILTLNKAVEHTGTVTLTGGVKGDSYTVDSKIEAKTLDASTQLSDLTLTVGSHINGPASVTAINQDIKLGSGDDQLTFDDINSFNGNDKLSDADGVDTVRAAFANTTNALELAGIEKLHIVATANTTIDLAKATDISELAILSDKAVNADGEIFSTGLAGVDTTDVITLKNSGLGVINFFGDADGLTFDANGNGLNDSGSYTQTFNGLTLENNATANVAVKIAAPLANGDDSKSVGDGIDAYNLGQLTTHGVQALTIEVQDEYSPATTTTIAGIWDRDLSSLTLKATGSINVGTITGNTTTNNITSINSVAVGGRTEVVVKALGDSAEVTLGAGSDSFNALGSGGNNVKIHGGNGNNDITGTAQTDTIDTGTGNDKIDADRGNNTIKAGAGNDDIRAKEGNNVVDFGSGVEDSFKYYGSTNANSTFSGEGTNALLTLGTGAAPSALDLKFGFAVGDGAELSVKFDKTTNVDVSASTLNGRVAVQVTDDSAPVIEANLSNLIILTGPDVRTTAINGGTAADVVLDYRDAGAGAYDVSTGAGNDGIVISQTNTGAHTIDAGAGADRVILSFAAGVDTLKINEGQSTIDAYDVVTQFTVGQDKLDVTTATVGAAGGLASTNFQTGPGGADLSVDADGHITLTGDLAGAKIGVDVSVDALLGFLADNAKTVNDVFFFETNAGDTFVFQNLITDNVIQLVGTTGVTVADFV